MGECIVLRCASVFVSRRGATQSLWIETLRPLVSACIEERTCEQQGVGSVGMCLFVCCQRSVSGGVVRGFRALAGIWVRDLPLAFRSRIRHLQDR
jgi:hypothetical protein